ncbi:MAG: SiaB family protein kinase [Cryomorphaceae bacterium]
MESQAIKQFTDDLDDGALLVNFQGEVHEDRISKILGDVEQKLEATEEDFKKQRKVYNILVETLQNLYHHTDALEDGKKIVTFILAKTDEGYSILAANYIDLNNVPPLKAKLDKISSLDKDGLRAYYKEVLDNGQYSVHGGGGLGIIDIARKSGNKLDYDFSEVSDTFGLYVLKIKV